MPRPLSLAFLLFAAAIGRAELPREPEQPRSGPGGAAYAHAEMAESVHGEGGEQFWVFEPREPRLKSAPVILFLHGFSAMDPDGYRGWIEHLVRRGNVVIYPRWQETLRTPPAEFLPNTITAMRGALEVLGQPGRTSADLTRFALVGHSAGAAIGINYAADASEKQLPIPKAAVLVQPGQGTKYGPVVLPAPDPEKLPEEMKLIVAAGDMDSIVGEASARRIWRETGPLKDRAYVTVQSDLHGTPRLRAGHLSPLSSDLETADTLDWRGWWRLLDAACDAAFSAKPMEIAPDMGAWSDGRPVKPLKIERPTAG